MATISIILTIISVLTAILLTAVVLIQNPKGQGGLGAIGGGVSEAMFGASAPTALVKITMALAIVFLLATLFNAAIIGHSHQAKSIGDSIVVTPAAEAAAPAVEAAEAAEAPAEAAEAPAEAAEAPATK